MYRDMVKILIWMFYLHILCHHNLEEVRIYACDAHVTIMDGHLCIIIPLKELTYIYLCDLGSIVISWLEK